MKLFKLSEVESLAITKWGSMEILETEQEKRRKQNSKLENRKEEEKKHFWDCKELFEPLKRFMINMEFPPERLSSYFKDKGDNRQGELIKTAGKKNSQEKFREYCRIFPEQGSGAGLNQNNFFRVCGYLLDQRLNLESQTINRHQCSVKSGG